jgi:lysozyme
VKAGGRTLTGLVNRRAAEAGLWAKGAFVSSRETAPAAPVSGIRSFLRGQW